nr:immunoglobulin heavy chain junction region [Macaca mulatta]
CAVLGSFDYW